MYNCVIIGCGKIAGGYDSPHDFRIRTHAKAITHNQKCHLLGVYDIDKNNAQNFAKQWGAEKVISNLEELKNLSKVDLISICTPTNTHDEILQTIIEDKAPMVWLEKPASNSLLSAIKMKKLAEDNNANIWVNYFRRYSNGFKKVKKIIDSGGIGEIEIANAYYTKGLRNNGSHMLDLAFWFLGDFREINSVRKIIKGQYPSASFSFSTSNCSALNFCALNYEIFEIFEIDIIGTKGRVQVLDGGRKLKVYQVTPSENYSGYNNLILSEEIDGELDCFMQAGLEMGLSGKPMPTLENEIKVQEIIDALEKKSGVLF